jgi:hypothetical protein
VEFEKLDDDKDGFITRSQFHNLCRTLQLNVSPGHKNILLAKNRASLDDIISMLVNHDIVKLLGVNTATIKKKEPDIKNVSLSCGHNLNSQKFNLNSSTPHYFFNFISAFPIIPTGRSQDQQLAPSSQG